MCGTVDAASTTSSASKLERREDNQETVQASRGEMADLIDSLTQGDAESMAAAGFEVLEAGFANTVCAIERSGQQLIVKRYTDLIFLRIEPAAVGAVDVYAGDHGAGPRVFHSGLSGLVEERLPGRTLMEKDMHCGDERLLARVASAVAALHRLPIPEVCSGEPMLWKTIDKMLEVAAKSPELLPATGVPSIDEIRQEVARARDALERHRPTIVLGHGDCKPSNVIATAEPSEPAMLIDFELGGPNYRGFDLRKLFRTAENFSEPSMIKFLGMYLDCMGVDSSKAAVDALFAEASMFEPLTWLEAAIFFLTMPHFKADETPRWHALAVQRWGKYEQSSSVLFAKCADSRTHV